MPKQPLVQCTYFDRKIRILFEFGSTQSKDSPLRVDSNRSLARWLGVPNSRVTAMRSGDDRALSKTRPAGQVSPLDLHQLAALYVEISGQFVSQADAIKLWRYSNFELFRERLKSQHSTSVTALLDKRPKTLEVLARIDPTERRMLDLGHRKEDADLVVKLGVPFNLLVNATPGTSLICLSETDDSRQLVVPSKLFDGKVTQSPQKVPHDTAFCINVGDGFHRMIVIELPLAEPPLFEPGPYTSQTDSLLISTIEQEMTAGYWRWGEATIYCVK